jgi:8-amino-7-oxononanoate synthase
MTLEERWQAQLDGLRRQARYRVLQKPCGVDFSSNDYLGYGKLFWSHADELSRSGQASRLLRGHHEIWEEVEARLASWHGVETVLMMNSGYVANEGLLATIIEPRDWAASDEYNHASIIDGLRLGKAERFVYRHNNESQLLDGLEAAKQHAPEGRQFFVVTESYFGMEADSGLGILDRQRLTAVHAIVDEAHATGCFGPGGSGMIDGLRLRERAPIVASVHTGGKGLGVPGAYICCSQVLKNLLVNRCRHFIFTTALPPQIGRWWLDALAKVQQDEAARAALQENAEFFRSELHRLGVKAEGRHYIVPIILGEDALAVRAADALREQGFDVRAIRPPTVAPGTARLRISIHADHDRTTLSALAEALARIMESTSLTSV